MRFFVTLLAIFMALAGPATASDARQCYQPAELEAEQFLRLHSELMYITYACKQGSAAQDLLSYYDGFTHKNISALQKAERTLIDFFKARFHDDGIAHLDDMRTKLGNEFGKIAADDTAPLYCRQYRDKVIDAYSKTPSELENQVRQMALTQKSYGPLCKAKIAANDNATAIDKKTR